MNRRDFFQKGAAATLGLTLMNPAGAAVGDINGWDRRKKRARNIIFLVSDGMSAGTLNMADMLLQHKEGRSSHWMRLYREQRITRALMDTASANALVTDSAAASSAWGGGVRVNNGALNIGPNGEIYQPILRKFQAAGKATGCVTTVPVTHATPAGFCVNNPARGNMEDIAVQYLPSRFDVMMGGGAELFSKDARQDGRDLFQEYQSQGYQVARTRQEMLAAQPGKPILGVFHEGGLPYALDHENDAELKAKVPTLAEMTAKAIELMRTNPKGFVLQVEGGKVDWAAHGNDIGGLLYDQIAFDDAIKVAIAFAEKDKETLVIITTDHGNANPGVFYGVSSNKRFATVHHFKQTNEWVMRRMEENFTPAQIIERIEAAQGIAIREEEAASLLKSLIAAKNRQPGQSPFEVLAKAQTAHTAVGWASMDHSADFVELAMFGPGSEMLKPFVLNTELHNFMLLAAGERALVAP
jgi:alkaline phosphatase